MNASKVFVMDLDETCIDTHGTAQLYPEVKDCLERLCGRHQVVLLTRGSKDLQYSKLRQCDIEKFFSKIIVVSTSEEKLEALELIKSEAIRANVGVVVVGDRIDVEIFYGNQLKLVTVRVRRPNAKYSTAVPRVAGEYATYEVTSFHELLQLFV